MLAVKRLAGVAPEVNLKECVTCTPLPSANMAAHSGFETQRWSPNRGISGPTKRTYVLQNLKKNEQIMLYLTSCLLKNSRHKYCSSVEKETCFVKPVAHCALGFKWSRLSFHLAEFTDVMSTNILWNRNRITFQCKLKIILQWQVSDPNQIREERNWIQNVSLCCFMEFSMASAAVLSCVCRHSQDACTSMGIWKLVLRFSLQSSI